MLLPDDVSQALYHKWILDLPLCIFPFPLNVSVDFWRTKYHLIYFKINIKPNIKSLLQYGSFSYLHVPSSHSTQIFYHWYHKFSSAGHSNIGSASMEKVLPAVLPTLRKVRQYSDKYASSPSSRVYSSSPTIATTGGAKW